MHHYAKAYRFTSASEISSEIFPTGVAPSVVTIRRRLCKQFSSLKSHVPAKKPCLFQKNIRDRIAFCQKYKDWSAEDWENVIFSDESLIEQFSGRSTSVRRLPCQRYNPKYLLLTVKHCPKIMIWGAIIANQSGGLWFMPLNTTINSHIYLDILQEKLKLFINITNTNKFQHDGAPCHRAKLVSS